ncbi:hypothetical protein F5Y11DRAFT_140596 [Daldinia sp. FL1419]|nr:hypothetical protein F5Y11DRAFT_140596 [Daldinia sp. FL1419]
MSDYPMSPLLITPFEDDTGASSLSKINAFAVTCEFLDSLRASANVSDGAFDFTPDLQHLHNFSIPALRSNRQMGNTLQSSPLENPSLIDSSSNSRDKQQWRFLWWFVWKIDGYCKKLQECFDQSTPPDLKDWLMTHNNSADIRNVGLRGLGDILQGVIPSEFHEILSSMIVQHAIFHYSCETNSFESVESAFTGWRNKTPIIQTHQSSLDLVFERLKSADRPSENTQPARPHIQTPLFETGSKFTNVDIACYQQSITDSSLYPPGHPLPSSDASPWALLGDQGFAATSSDGYLTGYTMDQAPELNCCGPSRPEDIMSFTPTTNLNGPFPTSDINQPTFHDQTRPSFTQMYGLSPSPAYSQYDSAMNSMSLNISTPFTVFMKFINNFTSQGGLPHLFSQGSIRWAKRPLTSNAMVTEKMFFKHADAAFFIPLRTLISHLPHDPIIKAIISTTSSLILLGGLHSLPDVADYMISLGIHLLPTPNLCREFVRIVLQTCPGASAGNSPKRPARSQSQGQPRSLDKRIDEILKGYSGEYHPAHLLQSQNTQRTHRALQPRQATGTSRASSSQQTPSIIGSSGGSGQNFMDTSAEISNVTSNTTTPSVISAAQCEECGKTFTGKHVSSHLSRHKRQHRTSHVTIECPYCNKVFHHVRTDNIRTHCRNVHRRELPGNGKEYWSRWTGTQTGGQN